MLFQLKFYGAALARYKMPPGVSKMLGCVTRGSDERANYVTHKKKTTTYGNSTATSVGYSINSHILWNLPIIYGTT
jgi:hypothetical protein